MALGDIVVSIRADARSFSAATRSARQSSSRFRDTVTRNNRAASTSFQTLERAVFRARARMIGLRAVAGGVFAFLGGGSVLRFADEWRNAENRIATVSGSLQVARDDMKDLLDLANRSRGSINSLANTYTKLRLSRDEFDKDTTIRLLETVQKSLVIGGNTQQETRSVITQLVQGIAADQLGGEELRAIRESGFFLQKILAQGLGVTVGELKELGAESKLTAKAVTEALVGMGDEVDLVFDSIPKTIGQATTVLENQFREYINNVDNASGATETIASGIEALGNNIGEVLDTSILLGASAATVALTRSTGVLTQALVARSAQSFRAAAASRAKALADQTAATSAAQAAAAEARSARAGFNTALANFRVARSSDERLRANLRLLQARKNLTFADNQAAAASARLAVAQTAVARTGRIATAAAGALRGVLGFFGGPIGVGLTAIAAGFALWANNARQARERTAELLSTTERVLALASSFDNGNNFFTAASRFDTIEKLTADIDVFEARLKEAQTTLRTLANTEGGFTRLDDRGNNLREVNVPGRELTEDEIERRRRATTQLEIALDGLATSQRLLTQVENSAVLTNEEYIRKQNDLRDALGETGSVFPDKPAERYTDAIEKLQNNVAVARTELEAFTSGVIGAGEAQRVINDLISNGVDVSQNMAQRIRDLTSEVEGYKRSLQQEETVSDLFADLQDNIRKAQADLNAIGRTGSTEGIRSAVDALRELEAGGFDTSDISAAVRSLGSEYDFLKNQIQAANDNQRSYEQRLDSARSLAEDLRTPVEAYRDALREINSLQAEFPDILSQAAAEQARADAAREYVSALRDARGEQLQFSENLAEGILRADSLGDALRNVGTTIQNQIVDKLLLDPLTNLIDGAISSISNTFGGVGGLFGGDSPEDIANTAATVANTTAKATNTAALAASVAPVTALTTSTGAAAAAATASTTSLTAHSAASIADTTTLGAHTVVVGASSTALSVLTAAATAASSALSAVAANGAVDSAGGLVSSFAGFFADGGTIPQGQFGVVGEAGPELISAASGPLTVTPLSQLPSTNPGRVSQGTMVVVKNSYSLSGVETERMIEYIGQKQRETEAKVPSIVDRYDFDRSRGAA